MDELTLREVCNRIGVSRRAVQGYETAGLVNATHKNERGYLLYDEKAQSRIRKIKLFQNMGFSIKEIKSLMDAPATILKEALKEREKELQKEVHQKKEMLNIIREMLENL